MKTYDEREEIMERYEKPVIRAENAMQDCSGGGSEWQNCGGGGRAHEGCGVGGRFQR